MEWILILAAAEAVGTPYHLHIRPTTVMRSGASNEHRPGIFLGTKHPYPGGPN